jgi:hypothetical protein
MILFSVVMLLEISYDICTVQDSDVSTTMIYTHVLNLGGSGWKVPWITSDEPQR